MGFKGMLDADENSNYPSAAFEALKHRKFKERQEIEKKAHAAKNTSGMTLKNRMPPHKQTLRPKKVV